MFFSRPIQSYHSHADPIWLDGTSKDTELIFLEDDWIDC